MRKLLAFSFILLGVVQLYGQGFPLLSNEFPIKDVRLGDSFGHSISVDGNFALVGAPFYDADGFDSAGKAYVLEKQGDEWVIIHEISNPEPATGSQFGLTVLLSGNRAYIGAPSPLNFENPGKVFVYTPSGSWAGSMSFVRLGNSVNENGDRFGSSIFMSGDILAVGAPTATGTTRRTGAVYLFQDRDDVSLDLKLKISAPSDTDSNFGHTISGNENYLFVTAPRYDESLQNPGAAFVFSITNNFDLAAKLSPPNGNTHFFGSKASASSDTYVLTTYTRTPNGGFGEVYVYHEEGGWSDDKLPSFIYKSLAPENNYSLYGSVLLLTEDKLFVGYEGHHVKLFSKNDGWKADSPSTIIAESAQGQSSGLGRSVAYNGVDILIGDFRFEKFDISSGVVYAYDAGLVKYNETYQSTISAERDNLGSSVDVHGDYAIAGAIHDGINGASSGSAYIYHFDGASWHRLARLKASDGAANHYFGWSVAITEDRAVVSAPGFSSNDYRSGKTYIFEKPPGAWTDMTETAVIEKVNAERGEFGHEVAASDNEIVITQVQSGQSFGVGYAYVFRREGLTWNLVSELNPKQRTDEYAALFGFSVGYDGRTVAISSPRANSANGAVFVFEKPEQDWSATQTENARLTSSDGYFSIGYSVDVNDNTIISGGLGANQTSNNGAAYIFEKDGMWQNSTETAKLGVFPNASNIKLGFDVCITPEYALVSGTSSLVDHSSVYQYKKTNGVWKNSAPFNHENSDYKAGPQGLRIATSEDHLIVGAEKTSALGDLECGTVEFRRRSPYVRRVTTTSPDASYKEGDVIDIQVVFSQPIRLDGSPTGLELIMHDATVRTASYTGLSGNSTLNFSYVVGANDSTPRLNYENELSIVGEFTPRTLERGWFGFKELPHPSSLFSLAGAHDLLIDGDFVVAVPEVPVAVDDELEELSVYPNPFGDHFRINGSFDRIKITDVTGREVCPILENTQETFRLDLPSGLYFLHLSIGERNRTIRIIRQ